MAFLTSARRVIGKNHPIKGSRGVKGYIDKSFLISLEDDFFELEDYEHGLILDLDENSGRISLEDVETSPRNSKGILEDVETSPRNSKGILEKYPIVQFSEPIPWIPGEWLGQRYNVVKL